MAKNLKIDEPVLYSFIKSEVIGTKNFEEIKSIFNEKEDFEEKIKNLFESEKIKEYIENVFVYQKELKINFRYYQFLAVLFTEIFLDNFFADKEIFFNKINYFIKNKYFKNNYSFNSLEENEQKIILQNLEFNEKDLGNIAFWMATGSGKTFVSLANLLQFEKYNKNIENNKKLYNKIFITFNSDLLIQFKNEIKQINGLKISDLKGKNLEKKYNEILGGYFQGISLIKKGEKIPKEGESFYVQESKTYGNNLVLVDEAHLGAKSEKGEKKGAYKTIQEKLKGENGLKIEYSATFHDAIMEEEKNILKEKNDLTYIKSIIFDYNYHKFHNDGFGKDYDFITAKGLYKKTDKTGKEKIDEKGNIEENILNEFSLVNTYFYLNQLKKYKQKNDNNLENYYKPLMLYVGNNVTGGNQSIVKIIEFYNYLLEIYKNHKDKTINEILDIKLKEKPETKKELKEKIIEHINKNFARGDSSQKIGFLLKEFFNLETEDDLQLKLSWIKKSGKNDIIIGSIGNNKAFLAIYIGNESELFKVLDEKIGTKIEIVKNPTGINKNDFSIEKIAEKNNEINVLIGTTKKFGVGYDNFRISTIGLLDIDKSNIEAVQLFGRGVRLKGCQNDGKRCYENYLKEENKNINTKHYLYKILETLYVFSDSGTALQHFLKINELDVKLSFKIDLKTIFSSKNFNDLPVFEQIIKKQNLENILEKINTKINNLNINNGENVNIQNLSNASEFEKIEKEKQDYIGEIIVEKTSKNLLLNFYLNKIGFDNFINNLILYILKKQTKDIIEWKNYEEKINGKKELKKDIKINIFERFSFLKDEIKDFLLEATENIRLKNNIYLDIKYAFGNTENTFKEVENFGGNLNFNSIDKNELKIKNLIKLIVSKFIKQEISKIKNNFIDYKEEKFEKKQKEILGLNSYSITVNIGDFKDNKGKITKDGKGNLRKFLESIGVDIKDKIKLSNEIESILNTSNLKEINLNKFINEKILKFSIKDIDKDYFTYLDSHYYNYIYSTNKVKDKDFDILIKPDLIESEIDFIEDLKRYLKNHQNEEKLRNYNIYLVRNIPKKGVGFFQESTGKYRYPDFIMWIEKGESIRKIFIEPHGIRNDIADQNIDKITKLPDSLEELGWEILILSPRNKNGECEDNMGNENIICMKDNYIDKILNF